MVEVAGRPQPQAPSIRSTAATVRPLLIPVPGVAPVEKVPHAAPVQEIDPRPDPGIGLLPPAQLQERLPFLGREAEADLTSRSAGDDRIGCHRAGDHGVATDHRAVTDAHPREYAGPSTDPDVVPDHDVTLRCRMTVGVGAGQVPHRPERKVGHPVARVVSSREDLDVVGDRREGPDVDPGGLAREHHHQRESVGVSSHAHVAGVLFGPEPAGSLSPETRMGAHPAEDSPNWAARAVDLRSERIGESAGGHDETATQSPDRPRRVHGFSARRSKTSSSRGTRWLRRDS